jgi:hypothetical protein
MPAIVEFPTLVQEILEQYGDLFAYEPARQHLGEYLTGLLVAERKTVRGINSEFAVTTDQSCLNRWITEVEWDAQALNERRLAQLQRQPDTRYARSGVIPIDNTLIDHEGKLIQDAGKFWDHADQRYLIAHDYLIVNYVCPSGKHYPLEFRRFRKREDSELAGTPFKDHTVLFQELVGWVVAHAIPGTFTFDSYFTHASNLNHLQALHREYVGDLKFNRKLIFQGREMRADQIAAAIPVADRKRVEIDGQRQYFFTKTVRIPEVDHPVRLVILWKHREDQEACKMLITNCTRWEITRVLRGYRQRWTGTEPFHRDGKQHLGMGDCQLRSSQSQTRHMYLVFLVYSQIVSHMQQDRAQDWAGVRLQTVGEACRAALRETLGKTLEWVLQRAAEGWTPVQIKAHLALP